MNDGQQRRFDDLSHRVDVCEVRLQSLQEGAAAAIAALSRAKEELMREITMINMKVEKLAWRVGLIIGVLLFCADLASRFVFK